MLRTRSIVQSIYEADRENVKGVILIGHVAVPYSGKVEGDGHGDHNGAWPADSFYAGTEIPLGLGGWTDNAGILDSARWHNRNFANDGKFDQDGPPLPLSLILGRIDFHHLPGLKLTGESALETEVRLLKAYFAKANSYRRSALSLPSRAYVANNPFVPPPYTGFSGGPFTVSDVTPVFGRGTMISDWNWLPTLSENGAALGIHFHLGSWRRIDGVGSVFPTESDYFPLTDCKVFFAIMSASRSADFDTWDNPVRASITSPTYWLTSEMITSSPLTPAPIVHPLAVGKSMGERSRMGFNQRSLTSKSGMIHGDPTLTLDPPKPASNVYLGPDPFDPTVTSIYWDAPPTSSDELLAYVLYQSASVDGPFEIMEGEIPPDSGNYWFVGWEETATNAFYSIRPLYHRVTPSGTILTLGAATIAENPAYTPSAPIILNAPRGRAVTAGTTVALTVSVAYSAGLEYAWYHGTSTTPVGNSAAYIIDSFSSSNAGEYRVEVSNIHGMVEAGPVTLALYDLTPTAPAINIEEGETGTTTVSANTSVFRVIKADSDLGIATIGEDEKTITFVPYPHQYGDGILVVTVSDDLISKNLTIPVHISDPSSLQHRLPALTGSDSNPGYTGGKSRELANGVLDLRSPLADSPLAPYCETAENHGDFDVAVYLESYSVFLRNPAHPIAGITIREGTAISARGISFGLGTELDLSEDPAEYFLQFATFSTPNYAYNAVSTTLPATPPLWLGLRRRGDEISFYARNQTTAWQLLGQVVIANLNENVLAGLMVSGLEENSSPARALFRNYSVSKLSTGIFDSGLHILPVLSSSADYRFRVAGGTANQSGIIQSSDDGFIWTNRFTFNNVVQGLEFSDSTASSATRRFYRAKVGTEESAEGIGFSRVPVASGPELLGNQFDATAGNGIAAVLTNCLNSVQVKKWNAGSQAYGTPTTFTTDWNNRNIFLDPGEGFFLTSPANFTHTFSGTVPEETALALANSWNLIALPVALTGSFPDFAAAVDWDTFNSWNPSSQSFNQALYFVDGLGWVDGNFDPVNPAITASHGFYYQTSPSRPLTWQYSIWDY